MTWWRSVDWWSGVAVSVALSAFAAAMVLTYGRARQAPAVAEADGVRFYGTDQVQLGRYQHVWLVRDRLNPRECLLVIEITSENGTEAGGPRAVASQVWPCN